MIKAYTYIFYKFYSWAEHLSYDKTPDFTALLSLSALLLLNAATLSNTLEYFNIKCILNENSTYWIPIAVAIAVINYFYFLRVIGLKKIIIQFGKETIEVKNKRVLFIGVYILVTIVFYLCSLSFIR